MSMFNNYPQPSDYIPNNRPVPCCCKKIEIMAGETTSHSFEVPFDVEESTINYEVLYKLGTEVVLIKDKNKCFLTKEDSKSIISCSLSREDTLLFANTLLNAEVQIRFTMRDLSTLYTEIYKVKLCNALDGKLKPEPTPQIISGIGYTED